MRSAGAPAVAALWALLAGAAPACEAVTDGWGLDGRSAETTFRNRAASGRHEGWAPARASLIFHAGFDGLTDEYGHNILGPVRDAKILTIHIRLPGDARITCPSGVTLPEGEVFEDIAPHLADLDGDGLPEVIVVQSSTRAGARLAIYDRRARLLAATPPIGQRNRWLAPVGAADLDGDGAMEIAYVDRPHLAKTLRIWRWKDGELTEIAAGTGLTNHRIGDATISGGIRDCGSGPEMVLADGGWTRVLAVTFRDGALTARDLGPLRGAADLTQAMDCP